MIDEVIAIVREASKLMTVRNMEVEQKGNASNYVTSSDVAIQEFLSEKLTALAEGSSVLGEEEVSESILTGKVWIIDPIDGTSNYIRDIGLSVISVAYMVEGQSELGVVYNPYRDEMFSAVAGRGAYLNGRRIHVSDRDFEHSHLCSAMSLYDKNYAAPCFRIIEKVYAQSDDLRRLGSAALELAYLAAGRVELYFEVRVFAWDIAAAMLLIKEAGGLVRVYGSDKVPLDRPFPIYAANNAENMDRLEKIIYEEIPEPLY